MVVQEADPRGDEPRLSDRFPVDSLQCLLGVVEVRPPQLTNWVQDDRFLNMINFYQQRYQEELVAVFADGVEYDDDASGTIEDDEKGIVAYGRLTR